VLLGLAQILFTGHVKTTLLKQLEVMAAKSWRAKHNSSCRWHRGDTVQQHTENACAGEEGLLASLPSAAAGAGLGAADVFSSLRRASFFAGAHSNAVLDADKISWLHSEPEGLHTITLS
jgi:hypothetical protein